MSNIFNLPLASSSDIGNRQYRTCKGRPDRGDRRIDAPGIRSMIIPVCRACPSRCSGKPASAREKRELVILIKPTVVDSDKDWSDDITRSRDRVNGMSN